MRYKDWEDMSPDEKLDFLRAEIKNLRNAMHSLNVGLTDKFGRGIEKLEAQVKEVARDVLTLHKESDAGA